MTHEQCFDPFIFPSCSDFLDSILLNSACVHRMLYFQGSCMCDLNVGVLACMTDFLPPGLTGVSTLASNISAKVSCVQPSFMRVDVPYTQGGPSYKLVYYNII